MKPDILDGLDPQECRVRDDSNLEYPPEFIVKIKVVPYSKVLARRIKRKLDYVLESCGCTFSRSGNTFMSCERPFTEGELYRLNSNISKAMNIKGYKDFFLLVNICRVEGDSQVTIYEDYATPEALLKVWKLADAMRILGEWKYGRIEMEGVKKGRINTCEEYG